MVNTTNRVAIHTAEEVNRQIERDTQYRLQYYALHPEEIGQRLEELDREWDIERALEAHAASVAIASVLMGILVNRKWFVLPGIIGGFLLQHAIQGWCPPVPILRRIGMRTQTEIEKERYALKALRGDFNRIDLSNGSGDEVLEEVIVSIN